MSNMQLDRYLFDSLIEANFVMLIDGGIFFNLKSSTGVRLMLEHNYALGVD